MWDPAPVVRSRQTVDRPTTTSAMSSSRPGGAAGGVAGARANTPPRPDDRRAAGAPRSTVTPGTMRPRHRDDQLRDQQEVTRHTVAAARRSRPAVGGGRARRRSACRATDGAAPTRPSRASRPRCRRSSAWSPRRSASTPTAATSSRSRTSPSTTSTGRGRRRGADALVAAGPPTVVSALGADWRPASAGAGRRHRRWSRSSPSSARWRGRPWGRGPVAPAGAHRRRRRRRAAAARSQDHRSELEAAAVERRRRGERRLPVPTSRSGSPSEPRRNLSTPPAGARLDGAGREVSDGDGVPVPLTGVRKAAIVMLALGEERSAQVFKYLQEDEIETLAREVAALGQRLGRRRRARARRVQPDGRGGRVTWPPGGVDYARRLLIKSLGPDGHAAGHRPGHQLVQAPPPASPSLEKAEPAAALEVHPGRAPADHRADPRAPERRPAPRSWSRSCPTTCAPTC